MCNWGSCSAYLFVEIVASELDGGIWHYPYTIRPVPSHETSPPFLPPHLSQTLAYGHFVFVPAMTLYLE